MFGNYLLGEYEDVHLYSERNVQDCDVFVVVFYVKPQSIQCHHDISQFKITVSHSMLQNTFFFIDFILLKLHKNYVNIYLYSGLETIHYIDSLF